MNEKILEVPYYPQYNARTCQTAVVKMYAEYLTKIGKIPNQSMNLKIDGIRAKLETMGNPKKHVNWMKWIKMAFNLEMEKIYVHNESSAVDFLIHHIKKGYPVIGSVSHANNTEGHVILVVGFEQKPPIKLGVSPEISFYVHDPFGRYDPTFNGKRNKDYGVEKSYERSYVTKEANLELIKRDIPIALKRPEKGEYLPLSITSIRRNHTKEKKYRFKRYELISVKC